MSCSAQFEIPDLHPNTGAGRFVPLSAAPPNIRSREAMLGHRGAVIWLTGLSGAGKSTLANDVEQKLLASGILPMVLDGDALRTGLCAGLGFTDADRRENVRRAAETALLFAEAGLVVVTALISPFRVDRAAAAERCRARAVPFAEVYVNAPLDECERRDPKLLYRRARSGGIAAFTGISSPYEPPEGPTLELRTDRESREICAARLLALAQSLAWPSA